jgi:ATP-dependent Clp protease ATP-binding subunit ClpC
VDFRNTIIIMTSNVGAKELKEFGTGVGFVTKARQDKQQEAMREVLDRALRRVFRPEFLNRIDDIIVFNPLTKDLALTILEIQLDELRKRLAEKHWEIEVTREAKQFMVEKGYDEQFGARPLQRVIQRYLEERLADLVIEHRIEGSAHFVADVSADGTTIEVKLKEPVAAS